MRFKKRNRRRLSATQQLKRWVKPVFLLSLIAAITWGVYQYNPSKLLKVEVNWAIDNTNLVTQIALEKQIAPLVNELHQLDLHDIKHELEQHPWVMEAQVKRSFLDTINIVVTTHEAATRWRNINCQQEQQDINCQGYITIQGRLITPENLFYHQQDGHSTQLNELQSTHDLEKSELLLVDYQAYQQLLGSMKINTFVRSNIDTLHINPNITIVLGYNQQLQRLQKFIKIYAKLRKKIPLEKLKKATYDMRYVKGFTLKY